MAQAVGVQLHCGFLSLLFVQATSAFLMNTYGSPSTGLAQCITLTCSCQKPLRFSPLMRLVDHSLYWLPRTSVHKIDNLVYHHPPIFLRHVVLSHGGSGGILLLH